MSCKIRCLTYNKWNSSIQKCDLQMKETRIKATHIIYIVNLLKMVDSARPACLVLSEIDGVLVILTATNPYEMIEDINH